jgi:mannose-6-phosphate isomerase
MLRYPLRFAPILKERVWGGRRLASLLRRELPHDAKIGECWEIVDRPPDSSVVLNGPLASRSLHELCERHGRELLGEYAPAKDRFPLIAKLLGPHDRLSVQVHPTAAYVERHPEAEGTKNEMWYALEAEPGARVVLGLAAGVALGDLKRALATGQIEPLLRFVPVETGGFYYVPSGLIHSLLPGSVMVEIQQNGDTTFRLYDWGRLGNDGRPRDLHTAEAVETAETFLESPGPAEHLDLPPEQLAYGVERVRGLACPSFCVEKLRLRKGTTRPRLDPCSFTILTGVRGSLTASCVGGAEIRAALGVGDSALVPAGVEALEVEAPGEASLLTTALPRPSGTRD